jgi:hypothetical protein
VAALNRFSAPGSGWMPFRCSAHTLQLTVVNSLPIVDEVVKKVRAIVSFFSHSALAAHSLKVLQATKGSSQQSVITDVVTRWSSTFYMLERMLVLKDSVISVLSPTRHRTLLLSEEEWVLVAQITQVLSPFERAVRRLEGSLFVTLSLLYPLLMDIRNSLKSGQEGELPLVEKLRSQLAKDLDERWKWGGDWEKVALVASFLDPRWKSLKFIPSDRRQKAFDVIFDEVRAHAKEMQGSESEEPPPPRKKQKGDLSELRRLQGMPELELDKTAAEYYEYVTYVSVLDVEECPLQFWKAMNEKGKLPVLTDMARKYLAIQATSAASERTWSTGENTVTDKRSRLTPRHVSQLLFMNANCDLLHLGEEGEKIFHPTFLKELKQIDANIERVKEELERQSEREQRNRKAIEELKALKILRHKKMQEMVKL